MARQVYFDPFGQRVEGYRAGVQDEQALQGATRAARTLDWDYNNMAPIRLREAQLVADQNAFAAPFVNRAIARTDFENEALTNAGIGMRTGNWTPQQMADLQRTGVATTQPGGQTTWTYTDPYGVQRPYVLNNEAYASHAAITSDPYRQLQIVDAQTELANRQAEAEAMRQAAYIEALNAQTAASIYGAGGGGGAAGGAGAASGLNGFTPYGVPTGEVAYPWMQGFEWMQPPAAPQIMLPGMGIDPTYMNSTPPAAPAIAPEVAPVEAPPVAPAPIATAPVQPAIDWPAMWRWLKNPLGVYPIADGSYLQSLPGNQPPAPDSPYRDYGVEAVASAPRMDGF